MLARKEQHMLELRKEREKSAAQAAALRSELDGLKELLQAYETSSQRKDEVIMTVVLTCHHHHHWRSFTNFLEIYFFTVFYPQVIKNLSSVLDRQKEKLEKMRAFTQWRMKHTEAKEEVELLHHTLERQSLDLWLY